MGSYTFCSVLVEFLCKENCLVMVGVPLVC